MASARDKTQIECNIYYTQHISSKVGAFVTTCMLSIILILFMIGRFTLDYSTLHIPSKEEEVRTVAMKIHTISESQLQTIVHDAPVKKKRVVPTRPKKETKRSETTYVKETVEERPLVTATEEHKEEATEGSEESATSDSQEAHAEEQSTQGVEENNPTEVEKAIAALLQTIEKHKTYPRAARRAGYEGVVEVKVVISPQGVITQYSIHQTSGYAILDKSIMETIGKLHGKQITKAKLFSSMEAIIPVRYSLQS